jgi:hypothetical protein
MSQQSSSRGTMLSVSVVETEASHCVCGHLAHATEGRNDVAVQVCSFNSRLMRLLNEQRHLLLLLSVGLSSTYIRDIQIEGKKTEKKNTTAQIGSNVRVRGFNAGLLARSQFASRRSCDRPTRSRFSLVPEQMLSWYPNSTLHCMLPMQPSQW